MPLQYEAVLSLKDFLSLRAIRESPLLVWDLQGELDGHLTEHSSSAWSITTTSKCSFWTAFSQFESQLQLDRVIWPSASAGGVVTPQRRSHAPDPGNPIGECSRRLGASKREAYQSMNHACKSVLSLSYPRAVVATLLIY